MRNFWAGSGGERPQVSNEPGATGVRQQRRNVETLYEWLRITTETDARYNQTCAGWWARVVLFDVAILEHRTIAFDETLPAEAIDFSGSDWRQPGDLNAAGAAELLDPSGSRTIRIQGRVHGSMEGICSRCLEPALTQIDGNFDLFYSPMSVIAEKEDISIRSTETEIGFYEDPGSRAKGRIGENKSCCGYRCAASAESSARAFAPNAARILMLEPVPASRIKATRVGTRSAIYN